MKEISLQRFLHHFCDDIRKDKNFCFILGAGASKQSGIPTGAELVKRWIEELKGMYSQKEFDDWIAKEKINLKESASFYSKIYEKRFEIDPQDGFEFLEKIMDKKEPSCGYSVLAQIIATTQHKIVITTNFDSLIEDALFIYTQTKPLIVGHELLANYIKPFGSRPIIIKIHRDLFYSPKNDTGATYDLESNFKSNLPRIFEYYTPLIIGYGGNDGSLMGFLESLDKIKGKIFWFYRKIDGELNYRIQNLIEKFDGYAVQITGFDELMLQLGNKLKLDRLDDKIITIANERVRNYIEQIENINKIETTDEQTKDALSDIASRSEKDWLYYQLKASKEKDINNKETIYQEGLAKLPKSHELLESYAIFMKNLKKDYKIADELYKKAIDLGPNKARYLHNYAIFQSSIKKDYKKADELFKDAIDLEPNNARYIYGYAIFLGSDRRTYDKAEELYKKAIDLEPSNAIFISDYAIFLSSNRRTHDKAEELYKRAIGLEPNNTANLNYYASFLQHVRKDYDKAEELYKKAIDLEPNNLHNIRTYAKFLKDVRKDYNKAEELYKRAIELEPDNTNCLGNYAFFLRDVRKDYDKAEELYKKAIDLEPTNLHNFHIYAIFLKDIRKDYDKVDELYKKALALDPNDTNTMIIFARFLREIKRDYDKAEELYKRAIELNPQAVYYIVVAEKIINRIG